MFPKVGPSLRHVASKVGFDWLYAWLRNPQDFRPSTKMPRFFGLWEHLEGAGLEESERYEPLRDTLDDRLPDFEVASRLRT